MAKSYDKRAPWLLGVKNTDKKYVYGPERNFFKKNKKQKLLIEVFSNLFRFPSPLQLLFYS